MGHTPEGISQKYIARMILTSGPALRAAQRKVSQRIVALLNPTVRAPTLSPDDPQRYREETSCPRSPKAGRKTADRPRLGELIS